MATPVRWTSDDLPENWSGQEYLETNPLSEYWKPEYLDENHPGIVYTVRVIAYVPGMIGYAIETPYRIAGLVKDFLLALRAIFCCCFTKKGELAMRFKALGGSCLETASAILGTICPYIGYRLDEYCARLAYEHGYQEAYFAASLRSPPKPEAPENAPPKP